MKTLPFTTAALAALAALSANAAAGMGYTLTPTSDNMNQRTLNWGETFTVDMTITGDVSLPQYNSAIFQVRFTEPGIVLNDYVWDAPFGTGDLFDDSKPNRGALPLPIDGDTYDDPQVDGANDIELSNVSISGDYDSGDIVSLMLTIPQNYGFTGSLLVSVAPDTFADGFDELPVEGGQVLELTIVPAPSSCVVMLAGGFLARRRRSRCCAIASRGLH
jgi:hypothetical protein